jgi:hypothetical protein
MFACQIGGIGTVVVGRVASGTAAPTPEAVQGSTAPHPTDVCLAASQMPLPRRRHRQIAPQALTKAMPVRTIERFHYDQKQVLPGHISGVCARGIGSVQTLTRGMVMGHVLLGTFHYPLVTSAKRS